MILTPSSLANFLAFGLAEEISLIFFSDIEICSVTCFISTNGSDCFSIFVSSLILPSLDKLSNIKIKSPSETLSPTFNLRDLTFPSKFDGISTLDLSLSIVINGSFFNISWPSFTKTSITSTSVKSPIFGTLISISFIL